MKKMFMAILTFLNCSLAFSGTCYFGKEKVGTYYLSGIQSVSQGRICYGGYYGEENCTESYTYFMNLSLNVTLHGKLISGRTKLYPKDSSWIGGLDDYHVIVTGDWFRLNGENDENIYSFRCEG